VAISPGWPALNLHLQFMRHTGRLGAQDGRRLTG
jgi:hypothetical protein